MCGKSTGEIPSRSCGSGQTLHLREGDCGASLVEFAAHIGQDALENGHTMMLRRPNLARNPGGIGFGRSPGFESENFRRLIGVQFGQALFET